MSLSRSTKGSKFARLSRVSKSTVAGVACGLCCAGCVALYAAQVSNEAEDARNEALARYGGEQIEVCVASRSIAAGETITDGMVDAKLWLADLLPEGAITQETEIIGKQAGSSIIKGEVISSQRLTRADVSLDIPEGYTAVSIPARDVQAVGGALRAGMRADVYAIGSSSATLLVRNALVLATNATEGGSLMSDSVAWITLAVSPELVQELVTAAQNLELYLTLPTAELEVAEAEGGEAAGAGDAGNTGGADDSAPEASAVDIQDGGSSGGVGGGEEGGAQ